MGLHECLKNAHMMCYDRRKQHWPQVEADLAALGINTRRFIMGSGEDESLHYNFIDPYKGELPARQRLNYCAAVLLLLRRELDAGAQSLFLSEDDNQLCAHSLTLWPKFLEQVNSQDDSWDFYYIHAVRVHSRCFPLSENVLEMRDGCLGLRAVAMKRRAMEAIVNDVRPCTEKGIDGLIRDAVHPRMKVRTSYPCLLRGDKDQWSFQHEREVKPEWLDMCVNERGDCR